MKKAHCALVPEHGGHEWMMESGKWYFCDGAAIPIKTGYFDGKENPEEPSYHQPSAHAKLDQAERKANGTMAPREDALQEAIKLICGDRNNQYGPPTQDFDRTAAMLNAMGYRLNGQDLKASDVALIMSTLKLSRLVWQRTKRDSWVDLAGYAGCGFECAEGEE